MVAPGSYVPQKGDIVWIQFAPQAGHEQAGRRPALVVSQGSYNGCVGLALFCPITSRAKGYPFEVELESGGKAEGVVMSDQVKSLDWRVRGAQKFDHISDKILRDVAAKIGALIG